MQLTKSLLSLSPAGEALAMNPRVTRQQMQYGDAEQRKRSSSATRSSRLGSGRTAESPPMQLNVRTRCDFTVSQYGGGIQAVGEHQAHWYTATCNLESYDLPAFKSYSTRLASMRSQDRAIARQELDGHPDQSDHELVRMDQGDNRELVAHDRSGFQLSVLKWTPRIDQQPQGAAERGGGRACGEDRGPAPRRG